jgi:hypothetical protein
MKKTTLALTMSTALALAASSTAAMAGGTSPAARNAAAAPVTAPALASALSTAKPGTGQASAAAAVNPFLGVPLDFEGAKQQLEMAKVQSQLLDEKVKQRNAEIELQQLPRKREAELKKALGSGSEGLLPAIQVEGASPIPVKNKPKTVRSEKPAASPAPVATAAPALPTVPRVEVLGISETPEGRAALISINGNVATVKNGSMTPAGRVQIGAEQVMVGAGSYSLHQATLARLTMPQGATLSAAGVGPAPAPGGQAFPGMLGGVPDVLRNAGPAMSKGPLPPGLAPIVR